MDIKRYFVDQLKGVYQERIANAGQAESSAAEAAEHIRGESSRQEDAKAAAMEGRLSSGHRRRRKQAVTEMETLLDFAEKGIKRFRPTDKVGLGAMVDVRIQDDVGEEERTLLVLPVGAGEELPGPGGDGWVQVVTPRSPVGKALVGAREGDSFEVVVDGRDREWTVVDLG
ncbi:MAG: transcription elongation factor GreAB [Deltaproteobacteria bacterium]|nr:transcription elongation factor GreAB [Deltaproteobacteria bacterium]